MAQNKSAVQKQEPRKTQTRTARRTSTKPAVSLGYNYDIDDWTPEHLKVRPRTLEAKSGNLIVELEEIRWTDESLGFILGVGDGAPGDAKYNLMGAELTAAQLDALIDLVVLVRDRARQLGMPSDKRPAGAIR